MNGYRNVIGIIVIGALAVFLSIAATKTPRLTKLGKAYLERLQLAFQNLKPQVQMFGRADFPRSQSLPGATFAGVDPVLLGVGVFGTGILAGTVYEDYNSVFQKAQNYASGGCGSSCGSGCSSGDGGGSSCGGGCGGCGGCG